MSQLSFIPNIIEECFLSSVGEWLELIVSNQFIHIRGEMLHRDMWELIEYLAQAVRW